jgi:hypothetical protein
LALLGVRLFRRETDVGFDVACQVGEFFVGVDLVFGALAVAKDSLCSVLIIPEVGIGYAGFEGLQTFAVLRSVKENSEPSRGGVLGVRSGVVGLQESCGRREVHSVRSSSQRAG